MLDPRVRRAHADSCRATVFLIVASLGLAACGADRALLAPDPAPPVVSAAVDPDSLIPGQAFTATVTATPPAGERLAWVKIQVAGLVTAVDSVPVDAVGPATITRVYDVPRTAGTGTITITASGATLRGRARSSEASVAVTDAGVPAVELSAPADTALQPGDSLRIAFAASDDIALRYSVVRVTGAFTTTDSVDHAGASLADHSLRLKVPAEARLGTAVVISAEAVDYAGNRTTKELPAIAYADLTAPVLSMHTSRERSGGAFGRDEVLTLTLTASDNHKLAWVGYRFAEPLLGADSSATADTSAVGTLAIPMPATWVGTSDYTVFATDSSGNRSEVGGGSITLGPPAGSDVPLCTPETTALTVDASTFPGFPQFRWTPDCAVTSVAVMVPGASPMRWSIRVPEATIRSPIWFGAIPEEGRQYGSGAPLEPGVTYRVLLGLRTSATTERRVISATFVSGAAPDSGADPGRGPGPSPTPGPSANGRLVFASNRDGNWNIYSVAPDGTDARQLTSSPATDLRPALSADRRRIAFFSTRGPTGIYVMNVDGTDVQLVYPTAAVGYVQWQSSVDWLSWAPDGRRLAFQGQAGVYVLDVQRRTVAHIRADAGSPAWSPDGEWIAFHAAGGLHRMRPDGGGAELLLVEGQMPAWSPDGSRLAFISNRDGPLNVYVLALASRTVSRATTALDIRDRGPAWSPEGDRIAFTRDTFPTADIWTVAPDGSNLQRVTNGPAINDDVSPIPFN